MNTKQKGLRFGQLGLLPALTLPAMAMAALCATSLPALAQAAAEPADAAGQPAGQLRFFVDLKDATLADALEMVFKAAGNPAHIIDDSAKSVNISSTTFPNHDWSSIVRNLTSAYNFKFYKNEGGTWVVEPRFPQQFMNNTGGEGGDFGSGSSMGGFSGRSSRSGRGGSSMTGGQGGGFGGGQGGFGGQQGGFGGGQQGGFGRQGGQGGFGGGNRPEVRNFANQQTLPAFGGSAAASDSGEEKSFRVLTVKHIPARGVAYLFQDTEVIPTEIFVMPAGGGMGGQGGMGGGMMGGMGGGMMGGMGGGMGGMGGGMMGGMGGGMGGMGGGMMGGMGGGMMGGGMGGMGGGMMGGMGGMGGFGR